MEGRLHDLPGDRDRMLNPPQGPDSTDVHAIDVHNHSIESCLSVLIWGAAKTDRAVTTLSIVEQGLQLLTPVASVLDGVKC